LYLLYHKHDFISALQNLLRLHSFLKQIIRMLTAF
jgi:hypothetical protein